VNEDRGSEREGGLKESEGSFERGDSLNGW
jgi:hypothetical protein